MSSKFARVGREQKPPGVCRKPPPGREWRPPDIEETPFQGFIDFFAPYSPYEGGLTAPFVTRTDPPNRTWNAEVGDIHNQVRIQMYWNPATNLLDFELECWSGGMLYDLYHVDDVEPTSWSPFQTGLHYPDPGPPGGHLRFQLWL